MLLCAAGLVFGSVVVTASEHTSVAGCVSVVGCRWRYNACWHMLV